MGDSTHESESLAAQTELGRRTTASWVESYADVLESMTEHHPKVELREAASEWDKGFAWWGQRFSILAQPSFWIGASAESWMALGRLTLSCLGVENPTDADIEATCRDLMAQTTAIVASQLSRQFGTEITGGDPVPSSQPEGFGTPVFRWSLDAGPVVVEGAAIFADAFLRHCSEFAPRPAEGERMPRDSAAPSGDRAEQDEARQDEALPKLDLCVEFRLGRTTLLLQDIFKLNVGSVIELDHSAIEPAEVVIHGRVLARGQVVVVNGNYGLKILQPVR